MPIASSRRASPLCAAPASSQLLQVGCSGTSRPTVEEAVMGDRCLIPTARQQQKILMLGRVRSNVRDEQRVMCAGCRQPRDGEPALLPDIRCEPERDPARELVSAR